MDKFVKRNKTQNKTILDIENETFNEEEQELIDDLIQIYRNNNERK